MSKNDIDLFMTQPQADFFADEAKYRAFVAGFGAGKTETLINGAFIDALAHPKALIGLYAPSYDLIRLILWPRLLDKLAEHGIQCSPNKTEKFIETHHPQCGNFILKSMDEPEKIVGYETFRAHIDELDVLKEDQARLAWNKIIARNRQKLPVINNINKVSIYTTPEGFGFVYDRWVKNKKPMYSLTRAPSYSNPFLPEDYIDSLRATYPAELIEAYIEGHFVNLTSGTVYKSYDRIKCDSNETILTGETLYIGCDFNVTKMAATVYVRRDGGKVWHAVDEMFNMYDTPDMISAIKNRYEGHKIVMYPDASGASRKSANASISDIALLQQAGFEVRAPKKNPFVKDRVMSVNTAFFSGKLYVNQRKCPQVAACLEQQAYDDKGEPEKGTGKDHQNDATGYAIAYEMPVRKPILVVKHKYPT